ncbi:hypothetical protein [Parafilimonas terrae]|uniref:Uncharacterized protein n=1 Tax=Parafilimonas terrae TaxID=1465490 RepID=A0A1I5ZHP2_9BACT|nr:hypothetical protein [Parafilimonas terrae]SFQ55978.1 hypothetical protein SAMN05444277_1305 [Parafilimonas terrae]
MLKCVFTKTAINFNNYVGTPYPYFILILVALFESFLAYKFLSKASSQKLFRQIVLTYLIANVVSFFSEYYLSIFLNGGHRTLVWIPWVKIIGQFQISLYLISFPIIFLFTVLSEFIIAFVFLKKKFKWTEILKTAFKTNLISTLLLIIIFNCILFNILKGQEESGIIDDIIEGVQFGH